MEGQHPKEFTQENVMSEAPRMLRGQAAQNEGNETEGLIELRNKYPGVPEEMFWEIYEFVKRDSKSTSGGRKRKHTKKRHGGKRRKTRRH
jgi:hypothetical protein